MPKKRTNEQVICDHFTWLLGKRGDVYTADGRSNTPPLGRHSLGVKDRAQALEALRQLDLVKAVETGKLDRSALDPENSVLLPLDEGRAKYEAHVARPRIAGGAKSSTQKRYRAVFDKFIAFAESRGINFWNYVTQQQLVAYAGWLDGESYAYATEYLELTTLKQAILWFIDSNLLPASCRITLKMSKPDESDTYCWSTDEATAIIDHCRERIELNWLANVLTALACTGLRISELSALRWADIDLAKNVIVLTDESNRAPRRRRREVRTIKNRRSRTFPIHDDLREILVTMNTERDGRVFYGPKGGVLKPDTVRRILVRDVLQPLASRFPTPHEEIGFADGRLHSFRHYFCSRCANSGVPEQMLMRWLGHHNSRMVRRYYHLHDDEAQREMGRINFVEPPDTGVNRSAG